MTVAVVATINLTFHSIDDDFRLTFAIISLEADVFTFQFTENDSNLLNFQSVSRNLTTMLFLAIASIEVIFVQTDLLASFFVILRLRFRLLPNHFPRPKFEA